MRRAILHIGTEKTGTSTLQIFLQRNRARLNDNGFHFPAFAGHTNQTRITAYAEADQTRDDLRIDLGVHTADDLAAFRARFEAEAEAELAAHAGRTVVISNEHLSSRLNAPSEVARLKGFLERHFDDVTIAVYLRRQDQVAVSLYSTLLKFGGDRWEILPDPTAQPGYWDYGRLLGLWADAFGRAAVVPRIFDRAELVGGSVVTDFCTRWGLGEGYEAVKNANESLQPAAQEVLRRLNTHYPGYLDGDFNRWRGELGPRFSQLFPGRGVQPSRAEAEAFYRHFTAQNEAVRRDWFPDRATLFSEDFSGYPETPDPRAFGFDDAMEVMIALWRKTQGREIQLRYDLAVREGQVAELEGRPEEAIAAYARAMRVDPKRPLARTRKRGVEAALDAARHAPEPAAPPPPAAAEDGPSEEIRARWAAEDRAAARRAHLRKRLSLNGIRRFLGRAPR